MNWSRTFRSVPCAVALLLAACASTPPVVDTNVAIKFPADVDITSVEQADQALRDVQLARAQIDWRFHQKEQICYDNFFVNSCLLDAKNERRTDQARVKRVEVAANFFKRRHQVEEMDRNLYERNLANPLPDPDKQAEPATEGDAAPDATPAKPADSAPD